MTTGVGRWAFAVTVSINGVAFLFDDRLGSNVTFDAVTGELDLSLESDAVGGYDAFSLGVVPVTNASTGTGLAQAFTVGDIATSLGTFVIAGVDTTIADFTLTSISQSEQTSVPEPASLALLLPFAGWLAFRRSWSGRAG